MACCTKTIERIASGMFLAGIDKLMRLPDAANGLANVRLVKCRRCKESTWLSINQYIWFLDINGITNVIKNLNDLSVLPPLPKQNYKPGAKLFCAVCKCWLPAKARVKDEKCPLNKWVN
jgi:hypothetical protein